MRAVAKRTIFRTRLIATLFPCGEALEILYLLVSRTRRLAIIFRRQLARVDILKFLFFKLIDYPLLSSRDCRPYGTKESRHVEGECAYLTVPFR
jgi:hypothetical protein